jgi:hypothetical protein
MVDVGEIVVMLSTGAVTGMVNDAAEALEFWARALAPKQSKTRTHAFIAERL